MEYKRLLEIDDILDRIKNGYSSHPEALIATSLRMLEAMYSMPVADFLDEKKFIADLKKVELPKDLTPQDIATSFISFSSRDEQGKLFEVDRIGGLTTSRDQQVKQKMLEHPDSVLKFIAEHKNYTFTVIQRNDLFKNGAIEKLKSLIETRPYRFGKSDKTYENYCPTDAKKFLEIIASQPTFTRYNLGEPTKNDRYIDQALEDTEELAKACGIEGYGAIYGRLSKQPDFTLANYTILNYINATLFVQLERYAKSRRASTPVNIRKDYHGDYIPKPPIDSTIKDIENPNPEKYKTLTKVYRTNEALKDENGLFATITDPTLFDLLPIEYQDPIKLLTLYNRSNRRGLVTCFRYAEANPNPPEELKIEELAKYNGAYADQIEKLGYLPKYYREQLLNELIMVKGTNTFYSYYDKKLQKEMIGSISFFNFDISTDGEIIKGFRYTDEYVKALNDNKRAMLHLAIPKGIDRLNQTAQDIAYKIIQKFVDGRRMSKTIKGEPLKMLLTDLYKGVLEKATTKQQKAKRKDKTINALDDIKATGEIIEKYEIVYEHKKFYVILYPAEYMQKAYKDAELSKALEQTYRDDQARRQADLEQLVGLFKEDFKSKKDPMAYLDELATNLEISQEELARYRLKPNKKTKQYPPEITDDLYAKIKEQLAYYEDN